MIIAIRYVNQPSAQSSGKYGNIVSQTGEKIYVPVDLLDLFKAQTTVEIRTKEQTWGTTPVTIAASGPTLPVQGQDGQAGYQRPAQNQAPYRPNTGFRPTVVQGGGRPSDFDPAKDLHIFVTGVVQQAMNSGKFTASEIPVLTQAAIEAYDRLLNRVRGNQGSQPIGTGGSIPANQVLDPVPGLEPGDPGPAELQ